MGEIDAFVAIIVAPLSVWLLFSGLDDAIVDAFCAARWFRKRLFRHEHDIAPSSEDVERTPEKPIAIFVPLWREHEVVARMIQENVERIRYRNYDIFVGAYPNDEGTVDAVREIEGRIPRVHLALCPHDGPTSKADCLNWIYQRMLAFEAEHGSRYEVVVTHDAEDLIHSESLHRINYYAGRYQMVQVPVLPLPTPISRFTHGVYCDEFSEYQFRDMPARQFMGSFLPSNGVGTGYSRDALERLACRESNRIFEPSCLTEDYENGYRLHLDRAKQIFIPMSGVTVATREYFPQTFRTAVRQRTRWITGISLQTWQRHAWRGGLAVKYWLWRDRKGLIGNPTALATNALLVYGVIGWSLESNWGLRQALPAWSIDVMRVNAALTVVRIWIRMVATSRFYGWRFASAVPLRIFWANLINSAAGFCAMSRYANARWHNRPLVWIKTEHQYPTQSTLRSERKRLGEILVAAGYISEQQLRKALSRQDGVRLGEVLIHSGMISEDRLYHALSLQSGVPAARIESIDVRRAIAQALPAHAVARCRALPFKVEFGALYVATPELPSAEMENDLGRFTSLSLRFQLVPPSNYVELSALAASTGRTVHLESP